MKRQSRVIPLLSLLSVLSLSDSGMYAQSVREPFGAHTFEESEITATDSITALTDSVKTGPRDVKEILESLGDPDFRPTPINKVLGPWVFSGYRKLSKKEFDSTAPVVVKGLEVIYNDSTANEDVIVGDSIEYLTVNDSTFLVEKAGTEIKEEPKDVDILSADVTPRWLRDALTSYRIQEDFMYSSMIDNPFDIQYAYWDLPVPPRLPEDDISFAAYIRKLDLPPVDPEKAEIPEQTLRRIHWLHKFNTAMQFSQAYVSSNWYQGGNNHLALLFNINWNVQLNPVYHPNLLFQSNLSYKLGLNSTPQDEVHAYSISEDLLQYNLNTGLKAFNKWFYSLNLLFKTQLLRNYEQNSDKRKASFLSPGELNLGLGMAYSTQNKKKTFQLTATVSPLSYNLKTCITDKIDHNRFNISPDRKTHSEIGSNGEVNMTWKMAWNIEYKSRIFLFTDYEYFLSDWEHTISFNINKFLSTQLYAHMRYDTSAASNTSWKKFMLREVLSFGLSYTFSTKP